MKFWSSFALLFLCQSIAFTGLSQADSLLLKSNCMEFETLDDEILTSWLKPKIEASQFVLVGEQHGILAVGQVTEKLYQMASPHGYHTLCIETDALAACTISDCAKEKDAVAAAKKVNASFPHSIAFYNNAEDYELFSAVDEDGGALWGIDQSLMTQFRLNFDHLIRNTKDKAFKESLTVQYEKAVAAYEKAMSTKDFMAAYLFAYDEDTHEALIALASTEQEKQVLQWFWQSKEIYMYNFSRQGYLNNQTRGQLMKANFRQYYQAALEKESTPKVVFKLGANHAGRGLNTTRIYDIGNHVSELAESNGKRSLHLKVIGITGQAAAGNPFIPTPVVPFDNTEDLSQELQTLVKETEGKYLLIDLEALRGKAKQFSDELQNVIFRYDGLLLVRDAQAVSRF